MSGVDPRILAHLSGAATVIWDFDGVIADTEPLHLHSYNDVLGGHGSAVSDEEFRTYVGSKEHQIWQQILRRRDLDELTSPEALEALAAEREKVFRRLANELEPREQAREMLDAAAEREQIILSSQHKAVLVELLERWDLAEYFSEIHALGSTDVTKHEELERIVQPRQANGAWTGTLIEDSPELLRAARELGLTTILVTHPFSRGATGLVADFVIEER